MAGKVGGFRMHVGVGGSFRLPCSVCCIDKPRAPGGEPPKEAGSKPAAGVMSSAAGPLAWAGLVQGPAAAPGKK